MKPKAASAVAASTLPDLKTLIHEHALFFDKLVELIPARFFLASNSDDKPWYPGLSKFEKQTLKTQTRENIKKSRRARLDPTVPVSSTLDLLKKSVDDGKDDSEEDSEEGSDEDEEEEEEEEMEGGKDANKIVSMDEKPVTYEELQERLRKRIAELSSGRNTRPEARLKYEKRMDQKSKKKVKSHTKKKNKENEEAGPSKRKRENEKDEDFSKNKKKKNNNKIPEPTDITFGQVKLDSKKNRKKHLPKEKELEKAKRLAEAKKDPEKGKKVSWKSAVSKAAGEKVHDDPRLLNKSLKREKKKQKKNAQKWKEREETVGKAKQEKQKSRMDNIKERIQQKKMRKIEKREKKLMRPGFEGRKQGYIN
ncbi:hypothetical protein LUZ60_016540 [Juncus effusus]|nr:hypothetical protein LUZ60_016540 [Juncus effusus]